VKLILRLIVLASLPTSVVADPSADAGLPATGFNGDRYNTLWTKSPFAIATPENSAASDDYRLVGLAEFDGVSYASLIVKQTQEHFILTSEKPERELQLVSVRPDANGGSVVIEHHGEQLVLHQETAPPANAATVPPPMAPPGPGVISNAPFNPSVGGVIPSPYTPRPRVRFHRPPIVIPPPPQNP
jgi:hypothetical protein